MREILDSFKEAFNLIFSFNGEIYGIIALTLFVTIMSTFITSCTGIFTGVLVGANNFTGKKTIVRFVQTFTGLPPVVAGLVVYLFLSRKGPLGVFGLLFTPTAMVIAQIVIIFPIITGLTISAVKSRADQVKETCRGLGLGSFITYVMLLYECRYQIVSTVLTGYGRAVSEVGAVMLVGGNILNSTRVMTTSIVLETGKGNYDKALALGIILLCISFVINWVLQRFQEES